MPRGTDGRAIGAALPLFVRFPADGCVLFDDGVFVRSAFLCCCWSSRTFRHRIFPVFYVPIRVIALDPDHNVGLWHCSSRAQRTACVCAACRHEMKIGLRFNRRFGRTPSINVGMYESRISAFLLRSLDRLWFRPTLICEPDSRSSGTIV